MDEMHVRHVSDMGPGLNWHQLQQVSHVLRGHSHFNLFYAKHIRRQLVMVTFRIESSCSKRSTHTHTRTNACVRLHVRMQPWVPQWLDTQLEQSWLTDIANRAPVAPASLPSCCLFTFVNARQSLNCATFSSNVTKLVMCGDEGGHQ
eukprot:1161545-Pelagomonas_calceolata.AAC.9